MSEGARYALRLMNCPHDGGCPYPVYCEGYCRDHRPHHRPQDGAEMTCVYVIYKVIGDGAVIFAGAWQDHDAAKEWCGAREDVKIAQLSFVPVVPR